MFERKHLGINTKWSNGDVLIGIFSGLGSHAMASGEDGVGLVECVLEQSTVNSTCIRVFINITTPYRDDIRMETGQSTYETITRSIVGMEYVRLELLDFALCDCKTTKVLDLSINPLTPT